MGNALRCLCGFSKDPQPPEGSHEQIGGYDRLARDLFQFDNTGQVPEGLSQYVESAKKTQANWYKEILAAWKEENPNNGEQAAILIVRALQGHQKVNVQGLLAFYEFSYPIASVQASAEGPQKWPKGVKFELHTLQVDARAVVDGDGFSVFVDTKNPKESAEVPISIQEAAIERREARLKKDYARADALQKQIKEAGYMVFDKSRNGEDILARKYRIRLRGVDAPESQMPYGEEAKEALVSLVQGKPLHILVYDQDQFGRLVGDIYAGGIFVQEVLLKNGWVWHYSRYDQRPEFAQWQEEAKAAGIGLWAASHPQKPWDWRKDKREQIAVETFA